MAGVSVRLKCQNNRCGNEFHRHYSTDYFEKKMTSRQGFPCESCGFPRMKHMKSHLAVKDGFQPGWQENIRQFAWTRGAYQRLLRQYGLQEIGRDYIPTEEIDDSHPCQSPEFIEAAAKLDNDLGSVAIEAMEKGEFFNDESGFDPISEHDNAPIHLSSIAEETVGPSLSEGR